LNFRRGVSEARIGFVVDDGHADWAVGVLRAVIMVMECFSQKGEEQEANEDE